MIIARATPRLGRNVSRLLATCCVAIAIGVNAEPTLVHGAGDTFATAGIKLAWAIERGATEATTQVVIGVAVSDAYAAVSLVSIDPFSREQQPAVAPAERAGHLEVRIPRARFADFPRSELHFYRSVRDRDANGAALVVYYLGVPDTAPEFADPGQLDRYLAQRLAANER